MASDQSDRKIIQQWTEKLGVIAHTLSDSQGVFGFYRIWIFSWVKFSFRIFSLAKGSDSKKVAIGVLPKQ